MNYTLKLFNTGQVTLPKTWRSKYATEHFLATETKHGLLIKPIIANDDFGVENIICSKIVETGKDGVIYYEDKTEKGLYFPKGIDPQLLLDQINQSIDG